MNQHFRSVGIKGKANRVYWAIASSAAYRMKSVVVALCVFAAIGSAVAFNCGIHPNPCGSGKCVTHGKDHFCLCPPGVGGRFCEIESIRYYCRLPKTMLRVHNELVYRCMHSKPLSRAQVHVHFQLFSRRRIYLPVSTGL